MQAMQQAVIEQTPLTITESLWARLRVPFFVGWPTVGAGIFGIQVLIVVLTGPEDSFLIPGLLVAVAVVLAGLAQPYASRRLSLLVRRLLAVAYWTDVSARAEATRRLTVAPIFECRGTIVSGIVFAILAIPGLIVVLMATGVPLALGLFGTFSIEITTFLAGMALSRSWPILRLFHELTRLQLMPGAFLHTRSEVLLFARVAGELAGIVTLAYVLAFSILVASSVDIPTGVTIGYLSLGGVTTIALFAMPQWQVSQLVRRNKAAFVTLFAPEVDRLYAGIIQQSDSVDVSSLGQISAALLTVRTVPEWVLLDPRLIAGFLISGGLQVGVGFLQLGMNG